MGKYKVCLLILLILITLSGGRTLAEEVLTGKDILNQVDSVLTSASRELEIVMRIINKDGQERNREILVLSKGQNQGLVKFVAPADVKGTAFLISRDDEDDSGGMWLYMPVLGSVRRIAAHMRNGSFMGTDFTYNEISMLDGSKYEDRYSCELLRIEEYEGQECYLLKVEPQTEEIEYSGMVMWVRRTDYMPIRLEIFDLENRLLKIMTNLQITEIDGYLTPLKIQMENVQKGTKTILEIKTAKYNLKIPDEFFTTRYLERGK